MCEIDALEAVSRFGQLLELIEKGEVVVITRRGKAIVQLSPPQPTVDRVATRAAIHRIRARAQTLRLGRFDWQEWKMYRDMRG